MGDCIVGGVGKTLFWVAAGAGADAGAVAAVGAAGLAAVLGRTVALRAFGLAGLGMACSDTETGFGAKVDGENTLS